MRNQATEGMNHAAMASEHVTSLGGHPSLNIGKLVESHKHDITQILGEALDHERATLREYYKLLALVVDKNVWLEEYAREQITLEEQHIAGVDKMMRKPGEILWARPPSRPPGRSAEDAGSRILAESTEEGARRHPVPPSARAEAPLGKFVLGIGGRDWWPCGAGRQGHRQQHPQCRTPTPAHLSWPPRPSRFSGHSAPASPQAHHPLLIPTNLPLQPLATFLGLYPSGVKLSLVLHDLRACSWSAGRA
jgi:hypothetical protein